MTFKKNGSKRVLGNIILFYNKRVTGVLKILLKVNAIGTTGISVQKIG
jgi:hypothetical protein